MDLKLNISPSEALRNPQAPVCLLHEQAAVEQEEALRDLRRRIKKLRAEKNEVSAQFRAAKGAPEKLERLRTAMGRISKELKASEQRRNKLHSLIDALKADSLEHRPTFPSRFLNTTPDTKLSAVSIEEAGNAAASAWDDYVGKNPRASLYHQYCWRSVVEEAFGHECAYYLARNQHGEVRGVLPTVHLASRLFGRFAVSLPYFNYGGALADDKHTLGMLLDAAQHVAGRKALEHIEYRSCEAGLSLPCSSRKVSMILQLPANQEVLEQNLGSKVRAQYRQASQHQPELRLGGAELLDDFYQVFARAMRDLGTPVYGKGFFEAIIRHQREAVTLVCVYIGGRPVATAFLLGFRDMLEIPWAAALQSYNHCNVNMWMYRQILGFAIDAGYGYFDFGRSTVDAGTYRFKKQWGARPLKNYWYYQFLDKQFSDKQFSDNPLSDNQLSDNPLSDQSEESGNSEMLPALNPDNPKFRLAIAGWKRLPLFVANALGPHIVKNLP